MVFIKLFLNSMAHILFDQALLANGGMPTDPAAYVRL
jgi:molecular chaperone HtpG